MPGYRKRTTSAFTRALGAACFAGATNMTLAFLSPGMEGRTLQRLCHPASARCCLVRRRSSVSKQSSGTQHWRSLEMVSSVLDLPASELVDAGASAPSFSRKRLPPLTETEERTLLAKVHQARILGRLGEELAGPLGVGSLSPEAWARKAGLDVVELQTMLKEGVEAKQRLVERNMPMVFKIVEQQYRWRLRGGQISTADLVQEGAYALGVAADRYNPLNKNRFLTYAVFVVRDKLDNAIAHGDMAISLPLSALKEFYTAKRVLTAELGRTPSDKEVERYFVDGVMDVSPIIGPSSEVSPPVKIDATMLPERGESSRGRSRNGAGRGASDATSKRVRKRKMDVVSVVGRSTSLNSVIRDSDGGATTLMDTLAEAGADPLRHAENGVISSLLSDVLTPREARLVRMACGLTDGRQRTMAECADELCLSVSRTKTLFSNSLEKMRLAMAADSPGLE